MPFYKKEKYPNDDIYYDEENDNSYNVYYNSGSPDFSGKYHSDIDAAGQIKYLNNNNNLYPNNSNISLFSNYNASVFPSFGNSNNNTSGGFFGININTNSNSLFGANKTGLFGNINSKGTNIFGSNNNNNTKNVIPLFTD